MESPATAAGERAVRDDRDERFRDALDRKRRRVRSRKLKSRSLYHPPRCRFLPV